MLLALDCVLGSDQVKFLMKILGTTRQAVWQTAVHHHHQQNYIVLPPPCFVFVTNCLGEVCSVQMSNIRQS